MAGSSVVYLRFLLAGDYNKSFYKWAIFIYPPLFFSVRYPKLLTTRSFYLQAANYSVRWHNCSLIQWRRALLHLCERVIIRSSHFCGKSTLPPVKVIDDYLGAFRRQVLKMFQTTWRMVLRPSKNWFHWLTHQNLLIFSNFYGLRKFLDISVKMPRCP